MTLEAEIKTEAKALGFLLAGIAPAVSAPYYAQYLTWLERGDHAEMHYLIRPDAVTARQHPAQLLPGVNAILVLGTPYPPPAARRVPEPGQPRGRIAAYALRADYHSVLEERLGQLAARIQALSGHPLAWRACVDSSPLLEKDYARLAGLGQIGRNSLLINSDFGSWLLLSELLLDLPLHPDSPLSGDPCEGCQRCEMACPTKAIRPDRTVDARRCLSYLTIEHRGPLPLWARPLMGQRIFGCDACQSACPVRPGSRPSVAAPGFSVQIEAEPELTWALQLTREEFQQVYGNTPVARCRYQGFRRNAAMALGNSRQPELLPFLQRLLSAEKDAVVADALVWAIEQLSA